MLDLWQANGRGEVPLTIVATAKFLAIFARNRGGKFTGADRSATHFDLAIRFQVANISPRLVLRCSRLVLRCSRLVLRCSRLVLRVLFAVNVIKVLGTGKIGFIRLKRAWG